MEKKFIALFGFTICSLFLWHIHTQLKKNDQPAFSNGDGLSAEVAPNKTHPSTKLESDSLANQPGSLPQPQDKEPTHSAMAESVAVMPDYQPQLVVSERYSPLFSLLTLSAEDRRRLEQLLIQKDANNAAYALDRGDPLSTPASIAATKLINEKHNIEAQIKSLLSEEDYEKYTEYEKSSEERAYVDELKRDFTASDSYLDETQEAMLISKLHALRSTFKAMEQAHRLVTQNQEIPPELLGKVLKEEKEYRTQSNEVVKNVLTAPQYELYMKKFAKAE